MPFDPCAVTVRSGWDGTGCPPEDAPDDFGDELADDEAPGDELPGVPEVGAAPFDETAAPPRGPAPVPVPEICDAQAAPSTTHAASESAGKIRTARKVAYPAYGFALTSVTFIVLPLGVSYSTVSPSPAPVSALPSGEAAE